MVQHVVCESPPTAALLPFAVLEAFMVHLLFSEMSSTLVANVKFLSIVFHFRYLGRRHWTLLLEESATEAMYRYFPISPV